MSSSETAKTRVFISHSSVDKPFVRLIASDIVSFDIDIWIDEMELNVGDSLIARISEAIEQSGYLLACLSPASVNSNWVQHELEVASTLALQKRGLSVLPFLVGDLSLDQIPAYMVHQLYIDCRQPDLYNTSFFRLLRKIKPEAVPVRSRDPLDMLGIDVLPLDAERVEKLVRVTSMPDMHAWTMRYLKYAAKAIKDPTQRYWVYYGAGLIGGEGAEEMVRSGLADASPWAKKGAEEGAKLLGITLP